jgi:hypothetical protein
MEVIQATANSIFSKMESTRAPAAVDRTFKSLFGCSIIVAHLLWNYMIIHCDSLDEIRVKHMLWALCFLKSYATESQMAVWFDADRKTVRKYVWLALGKIIQIEVAVVNIFKCWL